MIAQVALPLRKKTSHKGQNGRVLIVGGSKEYVGAPLLAGLAALRIGVDLVTIAAPDQVAWTINTMSPDIITHKCKGKVLALRHAKELKNIKATAMLIGNGIGKDKRTTLLVQDLAKLQIPKVIDADAISAVQLKDTKNTLFTPHSAEYMHLSKQISAPKDLQDNVILKKGPKDVIVSKTRKYENMTGNPGMTVGGTGDILAGICVGFLSMGLSLEQAATKAAFICGKAGELLYKQKGYGYIASDFLEVLPKVLYGTTK